MTNQIIRLKVVLIAIVTMFLSSCVGQDGLIANLPSPTSEIVPITETVAMPTATEASTSTPAPIPTETPEQTPTATKWPPAGPYNPSLMDHEYLTFGHRLIFYKYEDSTEYFPEALDVVFKDFYYESIEITDEGYFLTGSLVAQDRANRGKSYPVRIKVKPDMLLLFDEKDVLWTISGKELLGKNIKEKYNLIACSIIDKEKKKPLISEDLQDDKRMITQEKWRELRLLVGDLLEGGGETENYELVLNYMSD